MNVRTLRYLAPIFIWYSVVSGYAAAQGYPGYPYTIMTPERGAPLHHSVAPAVRGSFGSVLPAPVPRTALIPPEGSGTVAIHIAPAQQSPTVVPGLASPVPNLPHGAETFQDRASRCAFQQGLYNVPGNMSAQYMGACLH